MHDSSEEKLVEQIHSSGHQFVVAITGGGSGAISSLLQVPGASATVLEAVVPYSAASLSQFLGGPVEQYCSEKTARAIAMRAFQRARELSDADPLHVCGIGATASLATNRPKRGARRIHVACQTAEVTSVVNCYFTDSNGSRTAEEKVSRELIISAVAEACGINPPRREPSVPAEIRRRDVHAPPSWAQLLLGERTMLGVPEAIEHSSPEILFPGAFNPPHSGQAQMAEIASKRHGQPVTFELSITNVDKRPLDFIEIADRLAELAGQHMLLTGAPTFVEKARLAPGCTFVVGVDTILRIADPVYYQGDPAKRDAAIAEIAERGCRFLVFGRTLDGSFTPLSATQIPPALSALCDEVPESNFKANISSTQLRNSNG